MTGTDRSPKVRFRLANYREWTVVLLGTVVLSWLGLFIHNISDLPGQTILSTESAYPTLVYLVLVAFWLTPWRRIAELLLLVWVLLQLIGGAIISVLPLPFLPFHPEQTLHHYLFHVIYGLLQIPALIILISRRRGQ